MGFFCFKTASTALINGTVIYKSTGGCPVSGVIFSPSVQNPSPCCARESPGRLDTISLGLSQPACSVATKDIEEVLPHAGNLQKAELINVRLRSATDELVRPPGLQPEAWRMRYRNTKQHA